MTQVLFVPWPLTRCGNTGWEKFGRRQWAKCQSKFTANEGKHQKGLKPFIRSQTEEPKPRSVQNLGESAQGQ